MTSHILTVMNVISLLSKSLFSILLLLPLIYTFITASLLLHILCRTIACNCFHMITISSFLVEITPVQPTFCVCYPCVHHVYVLWLIMTSQSVMALLGMPHCGITMTNDIGRGIHCDITMGNDVVMCTYHVITIDNHLVMNLFCNVLHHIVPFACWNNNTTSAELAYQCKSKYS